MAKTKPRLKFEYLPPSELNPTAYNPRRMSATEYNKLRRSVEKWGMVEPIIFQVKGKNIIGGHQRHRAATELALTEVPCIPLDVSDREAKILNLALNKITGDWDPNKLLRALQDLKGEDLAFTGFDEKEFAEMATVDEASLRELDLRPAPGTLWLFLGIPVNSLGDVQEHVAALEQHAEIVVKTSRD